MVVARRVNSDVSLLLICKALGVRGMKLLICILGALLAVTLGHGQGTDHEVFAPVPAEVRPQFIENFGRIVELHKSQNWDELYDLISLRGYISKGQYVKDKQRRQKGGAARLLEFTPTNVTPTKVGIWSWEVRGCGEWLIDGRVDRRSAVLMVSLRKGKWTFSDDIWVLLLRQEEVDPCVKGAG